MTTAAMAFGLAIQATLLASAIGAAPAPASADVTLAEDASSFTLSNRYVVVRVAKSSGELIGLTYQGLPLVRRGYSSQVGRSSGGGEIGRFGSQRSSEVRVDPSKNGGQRAEVSCRAVPLAGDSGLPVEVETRYTLGRDDSGVYVTTVWTHRAGLPGFRVGEARYALKLNPEIFDTLAIDAARTRQLPTGADWDSGEPLDLKEARRMTTGIRKGEVEHKYDYSAILADTPAFGWVGSKRQIGLWLINPSGEYLAGGPTKVELTGHLDVNPGGLPTLLNMWHGSHYGGSVLDVPTAENWTKTIGPFLIHVNQGADPQTLRLQAVSRAKLERASWPYSWAFDDPAKTRGSVVGRLLVNDLGPVGKRLVGLTSPDPVDWQRDSKGYQYWTEADSQGGFRLPNVRPGRYALRAFADGVLGEYQGEAEVRVEAGRTTDLGEKSWTPRRFGRTLWEIGRADRSAAEFRHGGDYYHWGLIREYAREFPNDVTFVVGKSDPSRDWNYCQPPRIGEGRRVTGTTWTIVFSLPEAPKVGRATLRLAICGSRNPKGVDVAVNGASVGGTGALLDSGVMHRDGIRGYWCERAVSFDASTLKAGENRLTLKPPASSWVQGVLYDYVRLELDDQKPGPALKPLKVVILGDSTVSNYPAESKLRGWGQVIGEGFRRGVAVENLAMSGRSTKTFLAEGRLKKAVESGADFALIQFGHNDSHGKGRPESTDASTDFRKNLRTFIDALRKEGIAPILVTPMHRRRFGKEGKVTAELQPYADAMKAVAAEKQVPLIDLYAKSGALFESLGEAGSADFNPDDKDRTHFTEKGAKALAELVRQGLNEAGPKPSELLK